MNDAVVETSEVEQLRVQLAGCGVIAMSNTRKALAQQMPVRGAYGYSASLQDVYEGVLREIEHRESSEALQAAIAKIIPLANKETLLALAGEFHDGPVRFPTLVEQLTEAANKL